MKVAALFLLLALAGCLDPEPVADQEESFAPPTSWDYEVSRSNYTEGVQLFLGQVGAYTVELQGTVYEPNATNPDLVLIMHGRHGTCEILSIEGLAPHCPETPVTSAVPSMHGYDAFGYALAKKGFFVVSVDANGVNGMDLQWSLIGDDSGATARALVLQAHYDYLMDNHELSGRVGLIGHSRGGEAVNLAATTLTPTPNAIFSIAPTDFDDHDVEQVPFLVLLPECDGDVSDLQGMDVYRRGYEQGGPRYQVWMAGANHNFYNTVWTQDDARFRYSEGLCADESRRYSIPEQTRMGAAIATSFFQKEMAGVNDGQLWPMECHWDCPQPIHLLAKIGTPFQNPCPSVEPFRASPADAASRCTNTLTNADWVFSVAQM
ncbi:MAG: alpha/beta hydrolase family protein, partial [Thermoplasmatota archaeon]